MKLNPKQKSMKLHLFYCLMQLLLENLDELEFTSSRGVKLKQDLQNMCELLNNDCNNTYAVQKSTYFQRISNKINTVIRKEFSVDM